MKNNNIIEANSSGRFPANLLVSDDSLNDNIEHSSGKIEPYHKINHQNEVYGKYDGIEAEKQVTYGDSGSFSRYFDIDKWYEKIGEYKYNNDNKNSMLIHGDSVEELKKLDDNSVDLIVTDPPYGYSFMGKEWDKALPDKRIWKECLRVLKAGGFAYVMSAPRQDVLSRMMIDLEDVGFNTAFTSMYWAYATGFPKALNISKAIDKKLGVKPDSLGIVKGMGKQNSDWNGKGVGGRKEDCFKPEYEKVKATSEQAKKLDGSYAGFQPKPAVEVIIVCMKPLEEKGYIDQAMKNGKGVSWFDDCRIPYDGETPKIYKQSTNSPHPNNHVSQGDGNLGSFRENRGDWEMNNQGRYPANLLVSDNAVDTGNIHQKSGRPNIVGKKYKFKHNVYEDRDYKTYNQNYTDTGDFSRYFDIDKWYESQFIITPKASKSEKNKGLDGFEEKIGGGMNATANKSMKTGSGNERNNMMKNHHPTVKPLKLMSYLITLGSREGDVVLDPFMGSGTTPLASKNLGRNYIGIEREEEYFKICCARVGDKPTVLDSVEEKPVEENIEENIEEKQIEKKIVEEKPIEKPIEEKTICELCGVDYTGSTKEEHEARRFHQDYV